MAMANTLPYYMVVVQPLPPQSNVLNRGSTLVDKSLACKYQTGVEMADIDKQPSLMQGIITDTLPQSQRLHYRLPSSLVYCFKYTWIQKADHDKRTSLSHGINDSYYDRKIVQYYSIVVQYYSIVQSLPPQSNMYRHWGRNS